MAKQTKLQALVAQFEAKGLKVVSSSERTSLTDACIDFGNGVTVQLTARYKMSIVRTYADGKMGFGFENSADVDGIAAKILKAIAA